MEKYLGVKIILAVPMMLNDAEEFLERKIQDKNEDGYLVEYEDGYKSWSPKGVFEKAYRKTNGLTFGLAIEAMKKGEKVARKGWNGKNMWITISDNLQGAPLEADKFWNPHARQAAIDNGGSMKVLPTIIMKTSSNEILMGWLASQTDILADDWEIL